MIKPNLFEYAKSELSQDAFLSWLISWSHNDLATIDPYLNKVAQSFVRELIGEKPNDEINSVLVKTQWKKIDVSANVNDEYFIVIEDKKGTKEHSDQLLRYAQIANTHHKDLKIKLVYYKMEEQGRYSFIEDSGYSLFPRQKVLSLLETYVNETENKNRNNILLDYYNHIKLLDEKINSYLTLPVLSWTGYSWTGFFVALQREIGGNWDYVPNKSGGFMGFWWDWHNKIHNEMEFEYYLQLEQEKLVFKLHSMKDENRRELRSFYRHNLYPVANEMNIEIKQYGRIGRWMGVARLINDYLAVHENGIIDIEATVINLKRMEIVLKHVETKMNIEQG